MAEYTIPLGSTPTLQLACRANKEGEIVTFKITWKYRTSTGTLVDYRSYSVDIPTFKGDYLATIPYNHDPLLTAVHNYDNAVVGKTYSLYVGVYYNGKMLDEYKVDDFLHVVESTSLPEQLAFDVKGFSVSQDNVEVGVHETSLNVDVVDYVLIKYGELTASVNATEDAYVPIYIQFGVYNGSFRPKVGYGTVDVGYEPYFFENTESIRKVYVQVKKGQSGTIRYPIKEVKFIPKYPFETPLGHEYELLNRIQAYMALKIWVEGKKGKAVIVRTNVYIDTAQGVW